MRKKEKKKRAASTGRQPEEKTGGRHTIFDWSKRKKRSKASSIMSTASKCLLTVTSPELLTLTIL